MKARAPSAVESRVAARPIFDTSELALGAVDAEMCSVSIFYSNDPPSSARERQRVDSSRPSAGSKIVDSPIGVALIQGEVESHGGRQAGRQAVRQAGRRRKRRRSIALRLAFRSSPSGERRFSS